MKKKYQYRKGFALKALEAASEFAADPRFPAFLVLMLFGLHVANVFLVRNNVAAVPLGLFAVLYAPGYAWLDVLSGRKRLANPAERAVTAIALSICAVILTTTVASLVLRIPLTENNVALILSFAVATGFGARKLVLKRYF